MIYDVLEIFEKQYEEKGDALILDNYTLKDGLYVKINKDESVEYYIFKNNKNEKVKEYCFKDLKGNIKSAMYQWFKGRDYYSNYLNSHKSIDPPKKIIHNNNYLTLFMKVDNFKSDKLDYIKKKLFDKLTDFDDFKKKKEIIIINLFKNNLNNSERLDDINIKYNVIKNKINSFIEIAKNNDITNYVKIFFNEDINKYKYESNFYYSIKIFNDITYSEKIVNEIWGPSDSNFGLNKKKPFLNSKTKWSLKTPCMMTDNNAFMLKRFFDWLKFQNYTNLFPMGRESSIYINKHKNQGEVIINDYDNIPNKIDDRSDKLQESINFRNYLIIKDNKNMIEDESIETMYQLENKVNEIFYNDQLKKNYFGEVYHKLGKSFQNLIYLTRIGMVNYFKKHDDRSFYQIVKKYGTKFVIEHIKKNRMLQAAKSLNLKLSLLVYKGEKIMDIKTMQKEIIKRLETSNYDNLSSEEFFYLSGQVAKYLVNQSEKQDKKGDMLDPFLKTKKVEKLKNEIRFFYSKYNYKISLGFVKFNNAISLIMAYKSDKDLSSNLDSFLIGALSDNIFYMKKEEK